LAEEDESRAQYPSLRGKRVLVTGGGSGIGAGIVEEFARQGSDVIFFDILNGESEALASRTGARFERVDLTDVEAATRCIRDLIADGGAIDVLVNNAANDDRHKLEEVTEEYWDNRLNVNLKHQFFCSQAVVPAMRQSGGGGDHQSRLDQLASRPSRPRPLPDLQGRHRRPDPRACARPRPRQHPRELRRARECTNAAADAVVHARGRSRDRQCAVHQHAAGAAGCCGAGCFPGVG
jgi:hypothetical protein